MNVEDFKVERYFAKYEFSAKYLLSSSDCDGYSMKYVLNLASATEKEDWENLKLGYTETVGSEKLRQAIKQHYETIRLDEIVVSTPGEANFILMNILLEAGDHVICMTPMYQSLYQIAKDLGCKLSFWEPLQNNNKWSYNPTDLKKLIQPNTKLIVINFPHNPTGFSPSLEDYNEIIAMARENNIYIFSDEMYRFLDHNSFSILPSACDLYENAFSLWGTAKTFGLGGLRLGWLTSKNKNILKKVEKFKDYLSICNSATSEMLGTIALNNMKDFVNPNIKKIKSNILNFEKFCDKNIKFIDYYKPNSGSTAFVKLNINIPTIEFTENLVNETGIMLLPSETFEYGNQYVRIGFGRENMPLALDQFEIYINNKYMNH